VARTTLINRLERFPVVGSTNDVVAGWLTDGTPEVCVAVADVQTRGRGREGRTWTAPPGAALLLSLGFRPTWLEPDRAWRLAAIVSLAMAEAAEHVADVPQGTIGLKWPNDLVVLESSGRWRAEASARISESEAPTQLSLQKLAGVLGETSGLGTGDPRAIVGIGVNVDWNRRDFPDAIAGQMTSLSEIAPGPAVDRGRTERRDVLLSAFIAGVETRVERLRAGFFDDEAWQGRQVTNGRPIRVELADGRTDVVMARRVDPVTGGLVVESAGIERTILSGEVRHVRIADPGPMPRPTANATSAV
jgi:BirA family biotin operon repressor/biotin-[acetyl-CoA-carboxylase] ligase